MKTTSRSLLHVVSEAYQKNLQDRTSRLLYAAAKGKKDGVDQFHERFVDTHQGSGVNALTGFGAVLSGTTVLHVLEAPTKILVSFLHSLRDAEEKMHLVRNVKILSLTEEVPRVYKEWAFSKVVTDADDPKDMETIQLVWGSLKQMLQMGMDTPNASEISEKTMQRYFPSTQKLARVIASTDLCTPTEYLEIFEAPFNNVMDTEKVWPAELPVKF